MWVLGIELSSFGRTINSLNHQDISHSPQPYPVPLQDRILPIQILVPLSWKLSPFPLCSLIIWEFYKGVCCLLFLGLAALLSPDCSEVPEIHCRLVLPL